MYGNSNHKNKVSFFKKLKFKLGKLMAQHFPNNRTRVLGLKLCEFSVGKKVYIGQDLIIASPISEKSCHLIIGDRVAIGPRVTLVLSSDANWSKLMDTHPFIKSTVVLDDDCWIGAGAILLPGITVGKMAIVGAGSVVTKDVTDNSVVAGVPARIIKKQSE